MASQQTFVGECPSFAVTDGSFDVVASVSGLRACPQLGRGGDKVASVDLQQYRCKLYSTSPRTWPVADWQLVTNTDSHSILRSTTTMLLRLSCGHSLGSSTALLRLPVQARRATRSLVSGNNSEGWATRRGVRSPEAEGISHVWRTLTGRSKSR